MKRNTFVLALLLTTLLRAASEQVTIIDSGSTNVRGLTIVLDESGNGTVQARGGTKQIVKVPAELCETLLGDVKTAGPLDAIPVNRCMKSISFGTSLFIEFNGTRSKDLSCRAQADERAANLKRDAEQILNFAKGR